MNVEARLARLEAVHEIRALKIRYARACDAGYDSSLIGPCFTEDAVWDGGEAFGVYVGNKAICEFFDGCPENIAWAMHFALCDDIEVAGDGLTATGRWYLWQPMTLGDRAVFLVASYLDEYVKGEAGWQISHLALDVQALTPLDQGWVKQRFVS